MAELATCLTLGSFDPEDVAEIQGFIAANGGDVEAGVSAYEASLAGDLRGLADQVALKSAPEQFVQGKTAEELRDLEELRAAEAEMLSIPVTSDAPNFGAPEFFADREYVGPNGETLDYSGALNAMYEIGAQWAGGPVKQERKATILIGAPAAGKSSIAEQMIAPQQGAMIVDSDEFKKMVPEYQGGIGANAVHEESKVMSDVFLGDVVDAGFNIVIPKVGGNPGKLAKQIEGLKAKGYTVDIAYMQVERNEVMRRMVLRFFNTGRLIPPSYLLEQVDLIDPTYETLKQTGVADGYVKFDNNNAFDEPAIVLEDTRPAGRSSQPQGREGGGGTGLADEGQVQAPQEVRKLFQMERQVEGRRVPSQVGAGTGVAMPTNLAAAAELAKAERFQKGRDFKERLQAMATPGLTGLDDETQAKIVDFIFEDAMEAVQDNANAIGWYDDAITRAKAELATLFPEIADGGQEEFAFIWALAVTSNGLKVDKNFQLAAQAYEIWKQTGSFPGNLGVGNASKQINSGLAMYDRLLGLFDGDWEQARDFMTSEQSVRDIEATVAPIEVSISGEGKSETIRGAGILGPKIGNGFFSNLYGHFDGLTMDRWLMRSVGRWRGTLIFINEEMIASKIAEIKDVAKGLSAKDLLVITDHLRSGLSKPQQARLDALTINKRMSDETVAKLGDLINRASTKPAWRDKVNLMNGGEELRLLGNALTKYIDGQVEAPAGAAERTFLRGAFKGALERLQQQPGMEELTMADLQALLWYPEKLLYDSAKKKAGEEIASYADDEAPDYGNAARNLVRDRLGSDRGRPASGRGPAGSGPGAAEVARGGVATGQQEPQQGAAGVDGRGTTSAELYEALDDPAALRKLLVNNSGWAVVTATQEAVGDPAQNLAFNEQLRDELDAAGITYTITTGVYKGEPQGESFLILADEATALDLGRKYKQESILTNRGLVYSDSTGVTPVTGENLVGEAALADDFYSQLETGLAFSMGLDFDAPRVLQQSAVVDTPAFKAWFGGSKIVDANGKARQLFHGTAADVQAFDIAKAGKTDSGWFGRGFYFASDPQEAGGYAGPEGVTMPVYVKVENPFVVEAEGRLKSRDDAVESLFGGLVRAFGGQSHDADTLRSPQYYTEEKVEAAAARSGEAIAKANETMSRLTDLPDIKAVMGAIVDLDKLDNFGDVTQEAFVEGSSAVMDKMSERLPAVLAELGFDGVVVVPYGSRANLQGTLYEVAVFDPTQIKSAFNEGTFDADNPNILKQGPRGQIEIPKVGVGKGTSVIRLFETADESTFMHETAHFFLEVMNDLDAPELAGDMAAIRNFVGAKDGQKGFTTEQHEKFARGFEAYLREGNAPSLAMADAFKLFKTWLTRLYSSVRKLDVQINDEMRQVFDRMLATDEAIADARAAQGLTPLFGERPVGMTDTDWNTYQRMARRSADQAEQNLMTKVMAKLKREKQKWFKDEKAAVIEQVEREYSERREFRLFEALANKRWIGNDEVEADDFRIDKALLIEQFGEDIIPQLNRQALGGGRAIYAEGGNSPSEVAQFFGFKSAKEMVEAVAEAGNLKKSIEAEADRRLLEAYGDPFSDGTLEEEAMQAIHSEQQAAAAVAEARELTRQMGGNPTGMTSRLYAERAKDMLSRMTVGQASKPAQFLAAERRAAREAQQAFARVARGGDAEALSAARTAKERQVLNQHLYNQSLKIKEQVDKGRTKMMGYRKASVREKLDGIYMEQIDGLLDAYDFRVKSPGQVEKSANLTAYVDQMIKDGREAELNIDRRLIENARRMHYSKLTVDELQGLFDTIANIDHMGRFKQKLIDRKRKRDLNNSAERVAGEILSNHKLRKKGDEKMGVGYLNLLAKPDTIFIRLDGGDEFGATWEEMKRGIDESTAIEQEMLQKMADDVNVLYDKHYNHKQLRAMVKEKFHAGLTFPWTKQEIISLALNMGNKDNYQRAMDDRVAEERRLTPKQLDTLLSTLDDNDWRFVQGNLDMINSYWDGLAEVSKRRTGVTPKKVDAEVMYPGAPALFKGGYYPIKFDPKYSQKAAKDEQTATDRYMTAGHGSTTQVGNGMTQERQNTGGGRALNYDLHVGFAHMRETIRYTALSEAVDNTYRLLEHPAVFDAMNATGNQNTLKTLKLWLQDVAEGPAFNNDGLNWLARTGKNNFTMSRLSFNMKTVILQVTGITQSAAVIGKRNMLKGMMLYAKHPAQTRRDVLKQSAKMRERSSTFQKDIYDFTNDLEMSSQFANRYKKTKSLIAKAGFMPIVAMQFYVVDMPTWLGAYAKYIDEYNGDAERASLAADKMVERAQDTGLPSERSAFERGTVNEKLRQQDAIRIFTTLGGYMLTKANRAYVRGLQGRRQMKQADTTLEAWWAATNAAIDLTVLFAFEALMMGVMWELLDDDDDLEDLNEFMLAETGSAVVGGIPFVRDAAGAFRGYGGGGVVGSMLEAPSRVYTQWGQGEIDRAARGATLNVVGIVTGLPTTASLRAYEALTDDDVPLAEGLLGQNPLNRR